jgi:hypothetical protein
MRVPQRLPRYLDQHAEQAQFGRRLAQILLETGTEAPLPAHTGPAGGDRKRLRGIPAVAPGWVGGAIPGTEPLGALLAKESRSPDR